MTTANQQGFPNISQPFVDNQGKINQAWFQLLISLWNRTGGATGAQTFVTGDIKASGSSQAQDGWLICDGKSYPRADYAALSVALGGSGTTFSVPNLSGAFPLGAGGNYPAGSTGGNSTVTLTVSNLPAHSHPTDDPGHLHGTVDPGHDHTSAAVAANLTSGNATGSAVTGVTGNATTGLTIANATTGVTVGVTGTGDPVSILPPFAAVTYLIKT